MRPLPRGILLSVLVLAAGPAARAQEAPKERAPCCATPVKPLPPLPENATEKERWLRRVHEEAANDEKNVFLSTRYVDRLWEKLREQRADAPFIDRFSIRWALGQASLRVGELDDAIALLEECVALIDSEPKTGETWLPEVLFRLASAHFRHAEKRNCIARHNEESCIFPLSERAVHLEKEGAQRASELLLRLLALPQSDLRLEAIWLLNVAHMALGSWPDGVPEAHRLPRERLGTEATIGRFAERARDAGLARWGHAGSVVVDDFTGDGRLDLMSCKFDANQSVQLHRNEGGGRFADVTEDAGLSLQLGGIHLVHGDVDNDGRLDVLVLRGGGFLTGTAFPDSLLRQDRPGHFTDVTKEAGIEFAAPSRTAAFADVDRDGDLDLFIGCESEPGPDRGVRYPSRLFLNDGKGRFRDATEKSGIVNPERCVGAVFGDVDGDGDPDLYLSNFLARNRLFLNRGDGTFTDVAAERGVSQPESSGPCGFLDYDGDGDLDLFVTYAHHYRQLRTVAAWYVDGRIEDDTQRLFENDGRGFFRDVTEARGLRRPFMGTGLAFGDADNDGDTDIYVATGAHDFASIFPKVLLLNGPDRFRDATVSAGVGHLQKAQGAAFADIDDDGDLDIALDVGGYYQDDAFGNVLFANPGNASHWLSVELRGTKDNRFGVGARVRVRTARGERERDHFATIGPGASFGGNPLRAHLGLGDAERILFAEVSWPAAGTTQRVEGLALDSRVRIVQEGAEPPPANGAEAPPR